MTPMMDRLYDGMALASMLAVGFVFLAMVVFPAVMVLWWLLGLVGIL